MELIPHCLTPKEHLRGIRGLVGVGRLTPPNPSSALPPLDYFEAVPKYISGRTSYLRVRLAFHPYPQLIPYLCTDNGFGPSAGYYPAFNLAMGSSHGFGSNPYNLPGILEFPPQASESHSPIGPTSRTAQFAQNVCHWFRLRPMTPYSDSLSLRLRNFYPLTQLHKLTRRLILQ